MPRDIPLLSGDGTQQLERMDSLCLRRDSRWRSYSRPRIPFWVTYFGMVSRTVEWSRTVERSMLEGLELLREFVPRTSRIRECLHNVEAPLIDCDRHGDRFRGDSTCKIIFGSGSVSGHPVSSVLDRQDTIILFDIISLYPCQANYFRSPWTSQAIPCSSSTRCNCDKFRRPALAAALNAACPRDGPNERIPHRAWIVKKQGRYP